MRHKVENAEMFCIHTSRPYDDGASYKVKEGKIAIVSFPFWYDKPEVKVEGPCLLRVDHHGDVKKGA